MIRSFFLFFFFTLTPFLYTMKKALNEWPESFYSHISPGLVYDFKTKEKLELYKKNATDPHCTKSTADTSSLSSKSRIVYDWLYTLEWSKKYLLSKPFQTWTVEDLNNINKCLTRLTSEEPGIYQTEAREFTKEKLSATEEFGLQLLRTASTLNTNFNQLPFRYILYFYAHPGQLSHFLQSALKSYQTSLFQSKDTVQEILEATAEFYLSTVFLRPWKNAYVQTAYLIINIVLAQHNINFIMFKDNDRLNKALSTCFEAQNSIAMQELFISTLKQS